MVGRTRSPNREEIGNGLKFSEVMGRGGYPASIGIDDDRLPSRAHSRWNGSVCHGKTSIFMANAAIIWTFASALAAGCFARAIKVKDGLAAELFWYALGAGFLLGGAFLWISLEVEVLFQQRIVVGTVGAIFGCLASLAIGERIRPSHLGVLAPTASPVATSAPIALESPIQIEFGDGDKYERLEHTNGIVRRMIHISVFNESLDDISDCNIRLIAATPRPKTGDHPTNFPVFFGANFDLRRGKERKFIQIARFAENPGDGSILERDNIIISAASGGYFPGWTTVPIPSRDNPAILTLEAFAPGITSRTAHLHIWVDQRRLHAKII